MPKFLYLSHLTFTNFERERYRAQTKGIRWDRDVEWLAVMCPRPSRGCAHVCVHTRVCVHVYTCKCICVHVCTCVHARVCVYTCTHSHTCVCGPCMYALRVQVCMRASVCAHVCTHVCVCVVRVTQTREWYLPQHYIY